MFILIPLGGKGERFKKEGYKTPKALIKILDKPVIYYLLENLNLSNIEFVYIPYNIEYERYNFEQLLRKDFPNINFKFLILQEDTEGPVETIKLALNKLNIKDCPVLSVDCDNFYKEDIINLWQGKNKIITFLDNTHENIFSYAKIEGNLVKKIVEKEKISNIACTGSYGFDSYKILLKYSEKMIKEKNKIKNEYYISGLINSMLSDKINFELANIKNKNYFSLGTPDLTEQFKKILLFDLDGTLVNTDNLYSRVWEKILKRYNIDTNYDFFKHFIKGKSDKDFLNFILPNLKDEDIIEISNLKDLLMIQNIENENIIFSDVIPFIEKNKNSRIGIVTSSNKITAKKILEQTQLSEYVNLLIAAEDCKKHKPSQEPYIMAIKHFKTNIENFYIFEDSISGLKSAMNSGVNNVFLRESEEEIDYDCKFKKFSDVVLHNKEYCLSNNIKIIENTLDNLIIKKIIKYEDNLKTGYICDIERYKIITSDKTTLEIVYKISNFNNKLSNIANKLNLYNNEIFFYKNLVDIVDIKKPKFYNVSKKDGIIMENLNIFKGSFNLNLSKNIKLLMKVVEDAANMHKKFYFVDEDSIVTKMKNLQTINKIKFYNTFLTERWDIFLEKNKLLLKNEEIKLFKKLLDNFQNNLNFLSKFPLNFCHGDLKSPNIFYKDNEIPYYLDWQYIHLGKGISDIVFLLVESVIFEEITVDLVIKYYFKITGRNNYKKYIEEIKASLGSFPFFVTVWFNSENSENIIDKVFPINFMKNYLKYLKYFCS